MVINLGAAIERWGNRHGWTIIHYSILDILRQLTEEAGMVWFGCQRDDFYDIAKISQRQCDGAFSDLIRAGVIVRRRTFNQDTGKPILYHALASEPPPVFERGVNTVNYQGG